MKSVVFSIFSLFLVSLDFCFAQDNSDFPNLNAHVWKWGKVQPTELAPKGMSQLPWQDVLIVRAAIFALDRRDPSVGGTSYLKELLEDIFAKRFYAFKTIISFPRPAEKFIGQPFKVSIGGVRGSSYGPQVLMSFGGDGALLYIERVNRPPSELVRGERKAFHYPNIMLGLGANSILREYLFPLIVKLDFKKGLPVDLENSENALENLLKAHRESFGLIGIKGVYDPESSTPHQLNFILGQSEKDSPGMFISELGSVALQRGQPLSSPSSGCYRIALKIFNSVKFF